MDESWTPKMSLRRWNVHLWQYAPLRLPVNTVTKWNEKRTLTEAVCSSGKRWHQAFWSFLKLPYRRITLLCNLGSLFYLRHTKDVATCVCWQKQVQARNRTLRTVQSLEKSSVVAFYFPLWPSVWAKLLKEKRFVWLRVWGNTVYPSRESIAAGGLLHDAHCQETE